jgi:hypothetical protein
MPHCELVLYERFLRANWASDTLRHVLLLGNDLREYTTTYVPFYRMSGCVSSITGGPCTSFHGSTHASTPSVSRPSPRSARTRLTTGSQQAISAHRCSRRRRVASSQPSITLHARPCSRALRCHHCPLRQTTQASRRRMRMDKKHALCSYKLSMKHALPPLCPRQCPLFHLRCRSASAPTLSLRHRDRYCR